MFYKSMDKVKNMIQKNIQNILTPAPAFTYLVCVPTHVCTTPLWGLQDNLWQPSFLLQVASI